MQQPTAFSRITVCDLGIPKELLHAARQLPKSTILIRTPRIVDGVAGYVLAVKTIFYTAPPGKTYGFAKVTCALKH